MAAEIVDDGVYFIQNVKTGTVIELQNGSNAKKTKIQSVKKRKLKDNLVAPQLWVITKIPKEDGKYMIQNANSWTYMDLDGTSTDNGTAVVGNKPDHTTNQNWIITRNTTNFISYVIQNVAAKKYVNLKDGSADDRTVINIWEGTGESTTDTNQLWLIVRAWVHLHQELCDVGNVRIRNGGTSIDGSIIMCLRRLFVYTKDLLSKIDPFPMASAVLLVRHG